MNYLILRASDPVTLESKVRDFISKGWKPLGGVTSAKLYDAEHYDLLQALVK